MDRADGISGSDPYREYQGLLQGDWPVWRRFHEMPARTSHTFDAKVASQVASVIPGFLEEAGHFYAEGQRRLA